MAPGRVWPYWVLPRLQPHTHIHIYIHKPTRTHYTHITWRIIHTWHIQTDIHTQSCTYLKCIKLGGSIRKKDGLPIITHSPVNSLTVTSELKSTLVRSGANSDVNAEFRGWRWMLRTLNFIVFSKGVVIRHDHSKVSDAPFSCYDQSCVRLVWLIWSDFFDPCVAKEQNIFPFTIILLSDRRFTVRFGRYPFAVFSVLSQRNSYQLCCHPQRMIRSCIVLFSVSDISMTNGEGTNTVPWRRQLLDESVHSVRPIDQLFLLCASRVLTVMMTVVKGLCQVCVNNISIRFPSTDSQNFNIMVERLRGRTVQVWTRAAPMCETVWFDLLSPFSNIFFRKHLWLLMWVQLLCFLFYLWQPCLPLFIST